MMGACFSLLDFEPTEMPSWRNVDAPSISEMLDYIYEAKEQWENVSQSGIYTKRLMERATEELEMLYVYHTCQVEDVGIADKEIIRRIIRDCEDGGSANALDRPESSAYQETVNIYEAYKMLQDLGRSEAERDPETKGLLEVDSCVVLTHQRLMKGLPYMKAPGGVFSTEVRLTTIEGELHQYPKFETVAEARDAVMRLLDRYNMLYIAITNQEHQDKKAFLRNIFRCAAWLFYEMLSLHPFSDGNGRLSRLLLNYVINSMTPFPVPLHDVFSGSRDTYLRAVVAPRKTDGRPRDLMSLLVESTCHSWKIFLDNFNMEKDEC